MAVVKVVLADVLAVVVLVIVATAVVEASKNNFTNTILKHLIRPKNILVKIVAMVNRLNSDALLIMRSRSIFKLNIMRASKLSTIFSSIKTIDPER